MSALRQSLLKAEDALMATACLDTGIAKLVAGMPAEALLQQRSRTLWAAIKALVDASRTVDMTTVTDELERAGENINLPVEICHLVTLDVKAQAYADMLLQERERTLLSKAAREILNACDEGQPPDDIAAMGIERINESAMRLAGGDAITLEQAFASMMRVATEDERRARVFTGIPSVDRLTGGVRGGKMIVVGARPGVGKSVFGIQSAMQTAMRGGRALICSLEMDEREIMARMASYFAPITADEIERGKLTDDKRAMLEAAWESAKRLDILIRTDVRTPAQVRRAARRIDRDGKLALIVVDYLGLMESGQKAESRRVEVGQISRALKRLAQDLQVPVMALSQLNRQSDSGKDTKGKSRLSPPSMSELRDSGDVEQDANLVFLLHKPAEPSGQQEDLLMRRCEERGTRYMRIMVEKNRQGESGQFYCAEFDGAHCRIARFIDA